MIRQQQIKRRRTASSAPAGLHLCDLPDALLVNVARYLSPPSRALFAASMTAPSLSWQDVNWQREPSATSKAIISSMKNTTLDFEDVEKSLAKKLSDADIGAVLTCINAKDTLRILKLAGCINITGSGLEPLRGSTILELIGWHLRTSTRTVGDW